MKAITANALEDGAVVYLGDNDAWTTCLKDAARFNDEEAGTVLAAAQTRVDEITDAYLIAVDETGKPSGRDHLREAIRTKGPTVRTDLGRQQSSLQGEPCA